MHSFLCFSKIGFLHDIDLYLDSLSLEICDFDSKQFSLPVAISACRAAPMGANPLGHTFKPLTLYDISIYTIYFSHPFLEQNRDRLQLVFLPPYSPNLNKIEELWRWLKDAVINNVFFHNREDIQRAVEKFLIWLDSIPDIVIDRLCL